jgi:hypothetical protein
MQIGQQEHQVQVVVDRTVVDVIHVVAATANRNHAIVVEWGAANAIAPRATVNSVSQVH